ncbi:hypothetical protein [Burkholderia gladioli]|uniref:hypothetical protein n=1 Tax=Burkholderia gladioli TaxID=28095 RepID=UPI00202DE977|nr:hypothetical protein [Burkholderia gladioli]URV28244.1 hypothetical protein NAL90_18710 [Burkholderia gladioli]
MKESRVLVVLAAMLMLAGCDKGNPAGAASSRQDFAALSLHPADNAGGANRFGTAPDSIAPGTAPAAAPPIADAPHDTSPIDPPSPAIAMSAGVTETVDPPRAARALAPTIDPGHGESAWLAAEQSTPVVHYPPEPAADASN